MNDADRDLLAGAALGVLSTTEREHVAALVSFDAAAATELEQHRATVAAIEAGVARERPPADLFDRVLAEITPPPAAPRRRRWAPRLAAAGFAAAAVVLGLAVFSGDFSDPDARAAVAGTPEYTDVSGSATLEGGELVLELENVPPPPAAHHYEVWVLRAEGGGEMEAVGTFTADGDDARLELRLPGPGDYQAVDVSIEPDSGPAEHSGISLAGGTFQS